LINKKIHIFLYSLLREIFISTRFNKNINKLEKIIDEINRNILREKKENYLNLEYTKKNLKNILLFIKTQNSLYAGEIFENLLIIIFSRAFETRKENTFGKYLYNNMNKIRNPNNMDFAEWFKKNNFKPVELRDIKKLLENDIFFDDQNTFKNRIQNDSVIYDILLEINKEKYINESLFTYPVFYDLNIRTKRPSITITRAFFISVYIYYQNKN
jgi:hypothetical protein